MDLHNNNLRLVLELATTLAHADPLRIGIQFSAATKDDAHAPVHLKCLTEQDGACQLGNAFKTYAAHPQAVLPIDMVHDFVAPLREISPKAYIKGLEFVRAHTPELKDCEPYMFVSYMTQALEGLKPHVVKDGATRVLRMPS